jgi:hypothetical protein
MKKLQRFSVLTLAAFHILAADSPARPDGSSLGITNIIDAAKGIYGTAFGTSEEKFIKMHGEPTGRLRLSPRDSALIYGKDHAFLFLDSRLIGVRITGGVFDWKIATALTNATRFDTIEWKLDNGIHKGMALSEVQKIVGDNIADNKYTFAYRVGRTTVEIDFIQQDLELDQKSTVYGVLVKWQ